MGADVERRVIEYFFLEHLFSLLFSHLPFHEVEGWVCFLHLDGTLLSFLFVEYWAEVSVFSVVFTAVHHFILVVLIILLKLAT